MCIYKLALGPNCDHSSSITGFLFPVVREGIKTIGKAERKLKTPGFLLGLIQATSPPAPA